MVIDYADTYNTMQTLSENFEGFSQILKEQSGEKRYLDVFTHPIALFMNMKLGDSVGIDYADTHFRTLRSNIFAKTKKIVIPFLPVHMGP